MSDRTYGAVVVGGGVVGLAAAWHLLRLGCRPLAVVERFRVGHGGGSSHGSVRMTRSTYATAAYATLMRHVHAEEWPPGDPRIAFASACSGHGFKFAPMTGRMLAELVVNGRADLPGGPATASLFALRRGAAPRADTPA